MSEIIDAMNALSDRKQAAVAMEPNDETPLTIGIIDQDVYRRVLSDLDVDVAEMHEISDEVARLLFIPAALTTGPVVYGSSCFLEGFMIALILMYRRTK